MAGVHAQYAAQGSQAPEQHHPGSAELSVVARTLGTVLDPFEATAGGAEANHRDAAATLRLLGTGLGRYAIATG